jgi:SET domain-containing protein
MQLAIGKNQSAFALWLPKAYNPGRAFQISDRLFYISSLYYFTFDIHYSLIPMILPCLYIAPTSEMGRGVFTSEKLKAGTVIEVAPVIVMSKKDRQLIDQTLLHDYIFEWGDNHDQICMALGYVPIYNHSYKSNCEYEMDYGNDLITIKTVRAIKAGEELFINYNGDWNDQKKLWFEAV